MKSCDMPRTLYHYILKYLHHSFIFNSLIQYISENLVDARYSGPHWEQESRSKKRFISVRGGQAGKVVDGGQPEVVRKVPWRW